MSGPAPQELAIPRMPATKSTKAASACSAATVHQNHLSVPALGPVAESQPGDQVEAVM